MLKCNAEVFFMPSYSLVNAIEMCKTEGVVDVFQVVKALRIQKPGAVLTTVSET